MRTPTTTVKTRYFIFDWTGESHMIYPQLYGNNIFDCNGYDSLEDAQQAIVNHAQILFAEYNEPRRNVRGRGAVSIPITEQYYIMPRCVVTVT